MILEFSTPLKGSLAILEEASLLNVTSSEGLNNYQIESYTEGCSRISIRREFSFSMKITTPL